MGPASERLDQQAPPQVQTAASREFDAVLDIQKCYARRMTTAAAGPDAPRVDEPNECVWWGDRRVDLAPKAFAVLRRLLQQPNQIVTKRALLDAAWPDTHVGEGVLTLAINQLREAFGDAARQPRFIETVHRRGYRWIGEQQVMAAGAHAMPTAAAQHATALFVGRETALAQLEQAVARAAGGARQMVFVTGDPGIGKTALLDEFQKGLAPRYLLCHGHCVDGFGTSDAYMPLLEALERLCRQAMSSDVVALLRRLAPTWLLQLPRLLETGEHDELRLLLAGSSGERMVRELVSFVEELTVDRTLVLVLEDLHWSDHATVGALAALSARREPARLLVIASYRPADAIAQQHPVTKLKHELAAKAQCIEIALPGLEPAAVGALLAARFPHHRLPLELAPQLQAETSGNPLFLLNALEELVQRRWLEERSGAWECTVDLATLATAVPVGTREMIGFRLHQLSDADVHLLEGASVIGQSFATQALAAALDSPPAEVESACARLARAAQFLGEGQPTTWPDGSAGMQHAFRHALYQQVLYRRVTPARRQLLHQRVGECLEKGFAPEAKTIAPQLALHFERGGDLERAVRHRKRAAGQALDRYAYDQAIEQLRSALAALAGVPASAERDSHELAIQAALLRPMFATHSANSSELLQVVERIRALCAVADTTHVLLEALALLALHDSMCGDFRAARSAAERMLERSESVPWGMFMASIARFCLGFCHLMQGELASGVEMLEASMGLLDMTPASALAPGIIATSDAALGHCLLGHPSHGRDLIRAAMSRAEASKHPTTIVHIAVNGLRIVATLRDDELLEECAARIASLPKQLQAPWQAWAEIAHGLLEEGHGNPGGVDRILRGREEILRAGAFGYRRLCALVSASVLLRAGRHEEADVVLTDALTLGREHGDTWNEAELQRLSAEVRLASRAQHRRGGKKWRELGADAEVCLRRALEVARGQGARWWELRAAVSLAPLLADSDRAAEARELLGAVYAEIEAGSDLPDMRAARELMRSLPPAG